ncbi:hypothetical protein CYMTET_37954 [Cymbomonas tetramitiformis]|uniref:Uncharacterized protein n=1 Tax=Cymbomonas tetramitiformis TaxID=36881 RepID=A0AAE0CCW2_9CHLO|nr:hypothetical protein CYMTET_37954 [Cymbomonas tetramitiformis]
MMTGGTAFGLAFLLAALACCLPLALFTARRRRKQKEDEENEELRAVRKEMYVPWARRDHPDHWDLTKSCSKIKDPSKEDPRTRNENAIQHRLEQFWEMRPPGGQLPQPAGVHATRSRELRDADHPTVMDGGSCPPGATTGAADDDMGRRLSHDSDVFVQACQYPALTAMIDGTGVEEDAEVEPYKVSVTDPLFGNPVQLGGTVLSDVPAMIAIRAHGPALQGPELPVKEPARQSMLSVLLGGRASAVQQAQAPAQGYAFHRNQCSVLNSECLPFQGRISDRWCEGDDTGLRIVNPCYVPKESQVSRVGGGPGGLAPRVSMGCKQLISPKPPQLSGRWQNALAAVSLKTQESGMVLAKQLSGHFAKQNRMSGMEGVPAEAVPGASSAGTIANPLYVPDEAQVSGMGSGLWGLAPSPSVATGGPVSAGLGAKASILYTSVNPLCSPGAGPVALAMEGPRGLGKFPKGSVMNPLLARDKDQKASLFRGDIFLSEGTAFCDDLGVGDDGDPGALLEPRDVVPASVARTVQALRGNALLLAQEGAQVRIALKELAELLGDDRALAARVASDAPALLTAPPGRLRGLMQGLVAALPAAGESSERVLRALGRGEAGEALLRREDPMEPSGLVEALPVLADALGRPEAVMKVAGGLGEVPSGAGDIAEVLAVLEVMLGGADHAQAAAVECPELLGLGARDVEEAMTALEAGLDGHETAQCAVQLKPQVLLSGAEAIDHARVGLQEAFLGSGHAEHAMLVLACNPAVLAARHGAVGETATALVEALAGSAKRPKAAVKGELPGERRALAAIQQEPCLLLSRPQDVHRAVGALVELTGSQAEALGAVARSPALLLARLHALDTATADALGALLGGRPAALDFQGRHPELLRCERGVLARGAAALGTVLGEAAAEVAEACPALLTLAPGAVLSTTKALEKALGGRESARRAVQTYPALLEVGDARNLGAALVALVEVFGDADAALVAAACAPNLLATSGKDIWRAQQAVLNAVEEATGSTAHAQEVMQQCPEVLAAKPKSLQGMLSELLVGLAAHCDLDVPDEDDSQLEEEAGGAAKSQGGKWTRSLWQKAVRRSWVVGVMLAVGSEERSEGAQEGAAVSKKDLKKLKSLKRAECLAPVLEEVEDRMHRLQRALTGVAQELQDAVLGELGDIRADLGRLVELSAEPRPYSKEESAEGSALNQISQEVARVLGRMERAQTLADLCPHGTEEEEETAGRLRPGGQQPQEECLEGEGGDLTEIISMVRSKLKKVKNKQAQESSLARLGTLSKAAGGLAKNPLKGMDNISDELRDKLMRRRAAGSTFANGGDAAEKAQYRWELALQPLPSAKKDQMHQPAGRTHMWFGKKT